MDQKTLEGGALITPQQVGDKNTSALIQNVRGGLAVSIKRLRIIGNMGMKKQLVGRKFGRLTVVSEIPERQGTPKFHR